MRRTVLAQLQHWKEQSNRKPLILKGARQVGKTWVMMEFGKTAYEDFFYFNFDEEEELKSIFENTKEPFRLIELLGMIAGKKILPQKHLIILDEVQECPNALNALKYFYEKANEYHIIAAGSLLGTLLATPKSYPVGKVNIFNVYPMTFEEFLQATDEMLYQYYVQIEKGDHVEKIFHNRLHEAYNSYLIIGGMPECVSTWVETRDIAQVETVQKELIQLYENDFSKHHGKINSGRILMVFRSIVTQLAKENEKFIYGCIREGARAREFEEAIEWLVSAGMVIRVYNVSKPEHPLKAFEKRNQFKLFLFDVGLLKQMAGVSNEAILIQSDYQFKGPLTENYVLQQLRDVYDTEPHYYSENATNEIDFVVQNGMDIIPIEVKGGDNVKAASLKKYIKKYQPKRAVRFSKLEYREEQNLINIPLYLVEKSKELL